MENAYQNVPLDMFLFKIHVSLAKILIVMYAHQEISMNVLNARQDLSYSEDNVKRIVQVDYI